MKKRITQGISFPDEKLLESAKKRVKEIGKGISEYVCELIRFDLGMANNASLDVGDECILEKLAKIYAPTTERAICANSEDQNSYLRRILEAFSKYLRYFEDKAKPNEPLAIIPQRILDSIIEDIEPFVEGYMEYQVARKTMRNSKGLREVIKDYESRKPEFSHMRSVVDFYAETTNNIYMKKFLMNLQNDDVK